MSLVPSTCEYLDQPGTYLPFTDTYIAKINDIEECRSQCTIQNKYNCRSFNFNAFRKECFLSSDDSISLPSGLQQDRDFTFSERGGCNSGTGYNDGIKGEEREKNKQTFINIKRFLSTFFVWIPCKIFNLHLFFVNTFYLFTSLSLFCPFNIWCKCMFYSTYRQQG